MSREHTINMIRARRATNTASRRRRLPRQADTKAIEREYTRELFRIIELVEEALTPLRMELPRLAGQAERDRLDVGEGREIQRIVAEIASSIRGTLTPDRLERLAEQFAKRTETFQRIQLQKQIRAGLGADIFLADNGLAALIDGFATENAALIKSIPETLLGRVERLTTRGVQRAMPSRELAKSIEAELGIARNRARTIARDQIGSLYGQVNAQRQKAIGVDRFIWRTSNDERVREEHAARNGNVYKYSDPPAGELPGEPINCRCYAEPVLTDITDQV